MMESAYRLSDQVLTPAKFPNISNFFKILFVFNANFDILDSNIFLFTEWKVDSRYDTAEILTYCSSSSCATRSCKNELKTRITAS